MARLIRQALNLSAVNLFSEHYSFLVGYHSNPLAELIEASLGIHIFVFAFIVDSFSHYLQYCQCERCAGCTENICFSHLTLR